MDDKTISKEYLINFTLPNQLSSIEYLTIFHQCTTHELIEILSHLHSFDIINNNDLTSNSNSIVKLNHLTCLTLILQNVDFDEFEGFLLKFSSHLKILTIEIINGDIKYLDADRWERFISINLSSLKQFRFNYHQAIDDDFILQSSHLLINQDNLIYSIAPYDIYDHLSAMELCISGNLLTQNRKSFLKQICPLFRMFTHLDIKCDQMTIDMLIRILNALPNLTSIDYFELDGIQNVNLGIIATDIIWKLTRNGISHPMTLCLDCNDAECDQLEKLYQTIDWNNLLKTYTIHRQYQQFFIHWK
ncbi:hypothetical protein I4U23_011573 [Adineta vaga]|nr:hypothetical protein I4U23_011573 [Adineta vaga]